MSKRNTTYTGKLNLNNGAVGGYLNAKPNITIFQEQSEVWLSWDHGTETMQIKLNGEMHDIDPNHIINGHPLDVGAGTSYEREHRDLAVIREKYEEKRKQEPTLKALREEYDDLMEKYKMIRILEGDNDA
jgi:hypothetical protein